MFANAKKYIVKFLFSTVLLWCGMAVHAQTSNTITFTWKVFYQHPTYRNDFYIRATNGITFTVDWGDGTTTTYTGKGDNPANRDTTESDDYINAVKVYTHNATYTVTIFSTDSNCQFTTLHLSHKKLLTLDINKAPHLEYLNCELNDLETIDVSHNPLLIYLNAHWNNTLRALNVKNATLLEYLNFGVCLNPDVLDISDTRALTFLDCGHNRLKTLDLTHNTHLEKLYCDRNQLASLDLSQNTALYKLWCFNNKLPLSDLYAASNLINDTSNKRLGYQILDTLIVYTTIAQLITVDTAFGYPNATTSYTNLKSNSRDAVKSMHYTQNKHFITFLETGLYTIETSNDSILSSASKPAKVVHVYNVQPTTSNTLPRILDLSLTNGATLNKFFDPDTMHYSITMPCNRNTTFKFTIPANDILWMNGDFYVGSTDVPYESEEGGKQTLSVLVSNAFGTREYQLEVLTPYDSTHIIQPYYNMLEVLNNTALFDKGTKFKSNNTYQWYRNDQPIPGAVNGVLYLSQGKGFDGSRYSVDVTLTDGSKNKICPTTTQVMTNNLHAYPNPTNGELTIENGKRRSELYSPSSEINVYSINGTLVATFRTTSEKTAINISHLPNGAYVVRCNGASTIVVKK